MKTKQKMVRTPVFRPHLRLLLGEEIALGPGKAELLRRIREAGSISAAARQMKMSYMRAWTLIQTMNQCFRDPVLETLRGGQARGGARLTETGARVLALFEQWEAECQAASAGTRAELTRLLKGTAENRSI